MAKFNCVPPTIVRYVVPARVLQATAQALRQRGRGRREAVVLWQGRVASETVAEITALRIPKQIAGPRHFNVPLEERLRILDEISAVGEFILVQLHTHPRHAFHSPADDQYAITKHSGAISIVIPDFAMQWSGDLRETAVFKNLGAGTWSPLTSVEVNQLFEVSSE